MRVVRVLQIVFTFLPLTKACVQFELTQEVSVFDTVQVLANFSGPTEELYGVCARSCSRDLRCNAFDICHDNLLCKTIRGWTPPTPGNVSEGVCKRFQMMCQGGDYLDRQNGTCISHGICDFEKDPESSCFLSENLADDFDWTRYTGSTPSIDTGPTSAARGSHYKYIETSTVELGKRAILESSKTFQDKTYCLTMYYHMYGDTVNTLTIRTQKGNNAAIDRWQRAGDQGNVWLQLSGLSLPLDSETKILIEATKGSTYEGDIAIDYIELWPFDCP